MKGAHEVLEHEGWADIARAVGKAIGGSLSEKTAQRYEHPSWPSADDAHPLPVGRRGNGTRFLAVNETFAGWVEWFQGRGATSRPRAVRGDRRRRSRPVRADVAREARP